MQYGKIEFLGFETNGRIEFAEAKNKKLCEVYFAGINIQIEKMLEEEDEEEK
ncbi:MAG: hypothetical protein KBT03_02350 [Bacteroidales bacterium]|nr:hypothetical protein [Candidatus Scybalousia scybalohippi]